MKKQINEAKRMQQLANIRESQLNGNREISDDEIENEAERYERVDGINAFIEGAKWYREQLKSKQI